MTVKLMSDERQEQLMKAAEATVQLMNVGVDGDAALAKVAADSLMNDHEIDLVTHAVNNSRQLAHIQSASPEDREKPFPLIDGARVKAIKPEPWTDAERNSGRRYNLQEQPTPNGEAKADAPDSLGIQRKIMKSTPTPPGREDYHVRPVVDHLKELNKVWGIDSTDGELDKNASARPEYKTEYAWADVQKAQHKVAELRITYTRAHDQVAHGLDVLAGNLRRLDAPKFAQIELAAAHAGIEPALLDILYGQAELENFNEPRATIVKHASARMYVPANVMDYLVSLQTISEQMKVASDAWAALTKLAEKEKGGKDEGLLSTSPGVVSVGTGNGGPDLLQGTIQDTLGIGENPTETVQGLMGHTQEAPPERAQLSAANRSEVNQADAQVRLKRLMADAYISGHSLPEVVDAYNAALSVNPDFGDSEMTSYMRQHLATKGGVPLDIQLRAAGNRDNGDDR